MAQEKVGLEYMTSEEIEQEKKNRRKGIIGATITYAIILALLILYPLNRPDPPLQFLDDGGAIEILGVDAIGMNPTKAAVSAPSPSESAPTPPTPEPVAEEPTVTDPNSIAIEEKKKPEKPETKPQQDKPEVKPQQQAEQKPAPKPERKFDASKFGFEGSGGTGNDNDGTAESKGTGNKAGNQGSATGDPNGGWMGGGTGHGAAGTGGASLAGRKAIKEPSSIPTPGKRATLVMEIVVDADGQIVEVNGPMRGTVNISDASYVNKMKEFTKENYKFTISPDGAIRQKGSVTYEFYPQN